MNIAQIEESLRELVETPFDSAVFIYRLLEIYGAPKATVTKLRQANTADGTSSTEIVVKKKLVFRVAAKGKATTTVDEMAGDAKLLKAAPRFLIATDGVELYAKDIKLDQSLDTTYDTLNDSFDFFLPLAGIERYQGVAENPADIKATSRLAKLYDAILEVNPSWREIEHVHELNQLMTRLLFCFFAEGTSIFSKGQFTNAVMKWSQEDGSDTSKVVGDIFKALSLADNKRAGLPEYAKEFPYVNGGLFKDVTALPNFTRRARRLLRECGELDWSTINPDIFGSMIQAIVEPEKRADLGLHYTSVSNIMKVLHPLFLLSLEEEFEAGRDSQVKLQKLLVRLTKIRVFDPACGSGNFLIISYKELRKLEIRIFKRLKEIGQSSLAMTGIQLNQFFGIEYADFAAETAKLSLWISEYQMNHLFKDEFGDSPPDLPLRESGNISHDNALRANWLKVCPPVTETETYIVGNPPYLGSTLQNNEQKEDMTLVFSSSTKNYKNLDYVAGWYLKAADYIGKTPAQAAFVATNSICQGEQVAMLWPLIFQRGIEIGFAHQSFKWKNNAAGLAGVTCVIVGIRSKSTTKRTIYSNDLARSVKNIGPYLLEMDDTIVTKKSEPINGLPKMGYGNKPVDGGHLILSPEEKDRLVEAHPESSRLIRTLLGSQEFIRGQKRYCLWIKDSDLKFALTIPQVAQRIALVRAMRQESVDSATQAMAATAHQFREMIEPKGFSILVPIHFSEDREYFTLGALDESNDVISNACFGVFDAQPWVFSLLSSKLHAAWVVTVCGRIRNDIRYSNTMGYHTFPVPKLSESQKEELDDLAWEIIAVRESHAGKTIAWLYNPESMPDDLLQVHKKLDATIERIWFGRPMKNDSERLEMLFKQYSLLKNNGSYGSEPELGFKGKKK
jgi:N-6 DNA Methylase